MALHEHGVQPEVSGLAVGGSSIPGDRTRSMEAFVERALGGQQGQAQTPLSGGPAPGGPGAPGGISQARPSQTNENTNILKQVAGKITRTEMIEVLISRLKDLIPKETANA